MAETANVAANVISLPKGGGAISGLGEKFAPDLHMGTGNFTVPLTLPKGRNGFQPHVDLVYSTGTGNGPFGLGWTLGVPGISRKTSKGVPRYQDEATDALDRDVFVLSGAEDLVPMLEDIAGATRYHPRTEGLFALVDHHPAPDAKQDYWEVRTKDGLTSRYGAMDAMGELAAVVDPAKRARVFAWKLAATTDPFGNRIEYLYERDDQLEDGPHRWDQVYLSSIRYMNFAGPAGLEYLIKVKFEYESRPDPFSSYRAGFEIRTVRRCSAISIYTCPDGIDKVVRSYKLTYVDPPPRNGLSLMAGIQSIGQDGERSESVAPLTFEYTAFEPDGSRRLLSITGSATPSESIARPGYALADLNGDGLPDVVEINGAVRYWRNLGNACLDLPRPMKDAPAGLSLADPGVQLIDADGDGRIDLLVSREGMSGYFPLRFEGYWDRRSFQAYRQAPSFDLQSAEVKLVDLDGDGVTDAIRSGTSMECFFNRPVGGWSEVRWVERRTLDDFPNVNFSDPRVKWADMSGDGLQDVVFLSDCTVDYWPNLGYGTWGKRIRMPSPELPYGYDPGRILIGDVDGDGLADLIYVEDEKVTLWLNMSGSTWSAPTEIGGTPSVSHADAVRLVDFLGTGVSGVLWATDAAGPRANMFFLDLSGAIKPYLLNEMDNQMGAVTRVEYASSTRSRLRDYQQSQTRWHTPLPFPVQVVARLDVVDHFSGGKFTTEFRYHHGYWDGAEREFRGFGMVEQLDTEDILGYNEPGLHGSDVDFARVARDKFAAPVLTKTWFHQGPVGDEFGDWQELDLSNEYWADDNPLFGVHRSVLDILARLGDRRDRRDAIRALRGNVLRTETYALDGSERQDRPYEVTEMQYALREEAVPGLGEAKRLRIFFPYRAAQRATQWDRGDDPLTRFSFAEDHDEFGQPRRNTAVACPRGWRFLLDAAKAPYLATRSLTVFAKPTVDSVYIRDRVARTTTYEIGGTKGQRVFEVRDTPDTSSSLRVIAETIHRYDGPPFEGLAAGKVGQYGALVRTASLILTPAMFQAAYGNSPPPYLQVGGAVWGANYPNGFRTGMPALGGYTYEPGGDGSSAGYFSITDRRRYDFHVDPNTAHGMMITQRDQFGHDTEILLDEPYRLFPVHVKDSAGLQTQVQYDYRVLQPRLFIDPNKNEVAYAYTPMGFLAATWLKGNPGKVEGDRQRPSLELSYDFLAFARSEANKRQPVYVRSVRHMHHDTESDVSSSKRLEVIESREFSDGFGRLLQSRKQADSVAFGSDGSGSGDSLLPEDPGTRAATDVRGVVNASTSDPNVVVTGWQTYDNKGRVVEKYEPYFSTGWSYRSRVEEGAISKRSMLGQKVTLFYDPRGRLVRAVNPDDSEQRIVFGVPGAKGAPDVTDPDTHDPTPWEAFTYDANDNAGRTHAALTKPYRHHWDTPTSVEMDALGRVVVSIRRYRAPPTSLSGAVQEIDEYRTLSEYDPLGNLGQVRDSLGRQVFAHQHDLAGHLLLGEQMDTGISRNVWDATGRLVEQKSDSGALVLRRYDGLGRPTHVWANDNTGAQPSLRERIVYGDEVSLNLASAELDAGNLRGKVYRHYDEAGLKIFEARDFKGNVTEVVRQVIKPSQVLSVFEPPPTQWRVKVFEVDWDAGSASLEARSTALLDARRYRTSFRHDALGRLKWLRYPRDTLGDRKTLRPTFGRSGGLQAVQVEGETYVQRIAYNAKGQRVFIAYGNGVLIRYAYDQRTGRLLHARTERYVKTGPVSYHCHGRALQDYEYAYDLTGNILAIVDRVPGSGFNQNPEALRLQGDDPTLAQMLASGDALIRHFEYDPLYRLTRTTGRESASVPSPRPWLDRAREGFNSGKHGGATQDNAPDLTIGYWEAYEYDPADNVVALRHGGNGQAAWRSFFGVGGFSPKKWAEAWNAHLNLAEAWSQPPGNKLTHVGGNQVVANPTYRFDSNGNLTQSGLTRFYEWGRENRLAAYRVQSGLAEPSVHAQYLYDSAGERVMKVVRKQGGTHEVVTYIDGIFEHSLWGRSGAEKQNSRLHVMDNVDRLALLRIGDPHPEEKGPRVQYHLSDQIHSVAVVVGGANSSSDGFINREEFYAYGETSFGSFGRKRYRFSGRERDEESGLAYHGARYYAPWLARWISCDPAGVRDGLNLYTYVRNNPLLMVDPGGREAMQQPLFPPGPAPTGPVGVPNPPGEPGVPAPVPLPVLVASYLASKYIEYKFAEWDRALTELDESSSRVRDWRLHQMDRLAAERREGNVTKFEESVQLRILRDVPVSDMEMDLAASLSLVRRFDVTEASGGPFEIHHLWSIRHSSYWTPAIEQYLGEKCGLTLRGIEKLNTEPVPGHKGNHPDPYHMLAVAILMEQLERFQKPYSALQPAQRAQRTEQCIDFIERASEILKEELRRNPDLVKHKGFWSVFGGLILGASNLTPQENKAPQESR